VPPCAESKRGASPAAPARKTVAGEAPLTIPQVAAGAPKVFHGDFRDSNLTRYTPGHQDPAASERRIHRDWARPGPVKSATGMGKNPYRGVAGRRTPPEPSMSQLRDCSVKNDLVTAAARRGIKLRDAGGTPRGSPEENRKRRPPSSCRERVVYRCLFFSLRATLHCIHCRL